MQTLRQENCGSRVGGESGAVMITPAPIEIEFMRGLRGRRKPVRSVTVEEFDEIGDVLEAKRRLLQQWIEDGLNLAEAVERYAREFPNSACRAVLAVREMEELTGLLLRRE